MNNKELVEKIKEKYKKYCYRAYGIDKNEGFDCIGKDENKLIDITIKETLKGVLNNVSDKNKCRCKNKK